MLPPGSRVGEYEIEADLGEGGMARVYRARHALLDTVHAVKVLDPELRANPEVRQRFLDEARIQAKHLDHPGIVKVTNIVATAEHAALVMELVDGGSLEREVHALAPRPDEIRRIMLAVLDAIGHAHAAQIIHRDLKPANVLLARRGDQLIPKVTDFGIAKVGDGRAGKQATSAGARMGTLAYMSPEQIRGARDVTARSDIFSLGAMLYELATGALPFDGADDFEVMEKIVHGRFQDPAARRPGIDPVIALVIRRALAVDPAARYGSCEEMAAALRQLPPPLAKGTAPGGGVTAIEPVRRDRPPSAVRSMTRILMVLGAVAAVAGAAAGAIYLVQRGGQPPSPTAAAPVAADLARYRQALGLEGPLRATITLDEAAGTTVKQWRLDCDLLDDQAPIAVANFVGLATGLKPWRDGLTGKVRRGVSFYEGRAIYRVVAGMAIQGGRSLAQVAANDPGYTFAGEPSTARPAGALTTFHEPDKGNAAEFAILEVDLSDVGLDTTVFGQCSPLEIIRQLSHVAHDAAERPLAPLTIRAIAISAR